MGLVVMTAELPELPALPESPAASGVAPNHTANDVDADELLDDASEDAGEEDAPLPPIELALSEADCGIRLDKVLSRLVPQYSRSRIQQWIDAGHVTIDGAPARCIRPLAIGQGRS